MPALSQRLERFKPSTIAEIFALTVRLQEQGHDIVNLSTGEPDFDTDAHVCEAAHAAIRAGATHYTPLDGTTELKQAVRQKFQRDNGLDYTLDEIVVDAGAKPLLAHIGMALLDADDEVIVPTPCWTSHPGMVRLCGGRAVLVQGGEENGFKVQPEALESAISPRTKALLLNSPSNPTGAVYSGDELQALTDVLLRHPQVWVVADDIYEKLLFDGRVFATPAQVEPRLKSRVITVNGVSKVHAMTGWRIGYAGGPVIAMNAVRKIMSQATGNPSSISQSAAVAALTGPQDSVAEHVAVYQRRRDLAVRALNQAAGLSVRPCQGAFYLYVSCQDLIGRTTPTGTTLASSTDAVRYFLEGCGVALVPGSAFESDPYFRLSFATETRLLEEACRRIREGCSALR